MMKYLVALLLFSFSIGNAQNKFLHEKEISNKKAYAFENVDFFNQFAGVKLSGTLILPKSDYDKIVIIIPGSGKDTRYAHHKLAETFLQNNIGVYRFDERGVGRSQGNYSTTTNELSEDLTFCVKHLKSLPNLEDKKIGLLGHSLGGLASIDAYKHIYPSKNYVDFLIQVAAPVKSFSTATKHQIKNLDLYKVKDKTAKEAIQLLDTLIRITKVGTINNLNNERIKNQGIKAIKHKGFQLSDVRFWSYTHINLFKQDYEAIYKALDIPTMYLIGSKDKFVNPISEVNLLKKYNNPLVTIKVMKNLNHYLTSGTLKTNVLYNIDKRATDAIMNWIQKI